MAAPSWERQFSSEHDFPPTPVTTPFVLCTTRRCGSHLLGHLLQSQGVFGYPLEYAHAGNWERWRARAEQAGVADVLAYVKSVRTSPNGAFGIKLHHHHLDRFLRHESPEAVLAYRYVVLERRSLVAQAVSYVRSAQTGAWIHGMPERQPPAYDWTAIKDRAEELAVDRARWTAFLAGVGIEPLTLYYEDVRDDPTSAVEAVAAFLSVELPAGEPPSRVGFLPRKQGDDGGEWEARFVLETRRRLGHGRGVPGEPR